jgi:hypothetical protein
MWQKMGFLLRKHWKWVALALLAITAAIVVGALCATPAGAPLLAGIAGFSLFGAAPFAAFATMSGVAASFAAAGIAAAGTVLIGVLFNAATAVSNWIGKCFETKNKDEEEDKKGFEWPCFRKSDSYVDMGRLGGKKRVLKKDEPILSPAEYFASRERKDPGTLDSCNRSPTAP